MSLYAIADIHLSFGIKNKCMSIFKGWVNHAERLCENWNRLVTQEDTVVIGGDISWGKSLEQSLPDFEFIDKMLNGRKIIIKGNHDYWWTTITKMQVFLSENNINSIKFLHNNSYRIENLIVCGTRGWINEGYQHNLEYDKKILLREAYRLEASIKAGLELISLKSNCNFPNPNLVVFLHYPPIYSYEENRQILEILIKYEIKRVFSGHIHSSGMSQAFIGERYGIYFDMLTADYLKFIPKKIL